MPFATKYARPESVPETLSRKSMTERAGYIPARTQIEQLINAGVRLDQYRKEAFDFGPGEDVDPDFSDPTRDPNFDMADASALARLAQDNLMRQKADADEAARIAAVEADEPVSEDGESDGDI